MTWMVLCHIQLFGDGNFKMKKVLHYVSSMNRGGEETFIMNVFRNIDRNKVNFGFLYTDNNIGAYGSEIKKLGGKVYPVRLNRIKGKIKQLDNFFLLREKLKSLSYEYDYFQIHTQHAMDAYLSSLAAFSAGFHNVIVHSHNTSTVYNIKTHQFFKRMLHTLKITRFACGIDAGKWMFGNDKFEVINNGIELANFKFNSEIRKKVRMQMHWQNEEIIGTVGRLNVQKNQQFLIQAFKEYSLINSKARLVLIGVGELEKKLKKLVSNLGLEDKVYLLGARSDVNELYQGMDIFALPSLFEGLPVVLVEAQAADIPCVISNKITKEISILPNVYSLPIDRGTKIWSNEFDKILKEHDIRKDTSKILSQYGYNINNVAQKLQAFYLNGGK